MSRPIWFVNILKKAFRARFLLAKIMRRIPLVHKLVDAVLFQGDDIIYLPTDRVLTIHNSLSPPQESILPSQVVEYFIQQADNLWIMDRCICREAENCQDYPIDLGCLFMGEAVMRINPKLGKAVSKEAALEHVKRAQEAGLVHMIGRTRLDSVWLGTGPMDKLLTVCNCCPCCCLWRVLPEMPGEIRANVSKMPGVRVEVTDECIGCEKCTQSVCFVNAICLDDGRAVIGEGCLGCGLCVQVCPQQAITITFEDQAFIEHTVTRISNLVNVRSDEL
jgi:ferredoxin